MTTQHEGRAESAAFLPASLRSLIDEFGLLQKQLADRCESTERHVGRALAGRGGVSAGFYVRLANAVESLLYQARADAAKPLGLDAHVDEEPAQFLATLVETGNRLAAHTRASGQEEKQAALERARRLNDGYRRALELRTTTQPVIPSPPKTGWRRWALAAGGVVVSALVLVRVLAVRSPVSDLTMQAPSAVRSHLGMVVGSCPTSETAQQIRIYVAPDDGSHAYWLQNGPDAKCDPAGRWGAPVRFGNDRLESGQTLPLSFTVFAALIEASAAESFPGTPSAPRAMFASDSEFQSTLTRLGARQIVSARVLRFAKEACDDLPELVSPSAGNAPASLDSPVRLEWSPAEPRWIELRKGGAEVTGHSSLIVPSGTTIDLGPGLYELKIRADREATCSTDVWFEVKH